MAHLDEGFTRWAVPSLLTATQDTNLAYQFGEALATEIRAVGINMNLAPVADLLTNRDNPIIGRRSFGTYPEQVAPIIIAVINGMQSNGVMATSKHFPGHGDTESDSHLTLPVISYSQQELESRELIPFQAAIEAETGAIMVAHIVFPELQTDDSLPASLSPDIVTGLLRETMGYNGLIITDALDMDAIDTVFSPQDAAVQAVIAGNDMLIIAAHLSLDGQAAAMQAVVDAVRSGQISESQIDASVERILSAKERFGVLNWEQLDPLTASTRIDTETHTQLVERIFAAGITIVRGQAMLPLPANTAFIVPASRGTLRTQCQQNEWQIVGVSDNPSDDEIAWARQASQQADVTVVFTANAADSPQQQRLVAALPAEKTMVIALWSPYDNLVLPATSGYMVTYSPLKASIFSNLRYTSRRSTCTGNIICCTAINHTFLKN
ncbi:MAG: glycoside hydrolase family 3 N-terminal domain-containing protein [Anaerolineae bacterium]|nr:glycoside hydrolase family 3 N-terminal domain-containing protein [Anaerolineae bacterium]